MRFTEAQSDESRDNHPRVAPVTPGRKEGGHRPGADDGLFARRALEFDRNGKARVRAAPSSQCSSIRCNSAPREDFDTYPRDLNRDKAQAEKAGADLLFAPDTEEMYPKPPFTTVRVSNVTEGMCGASRPGHFDRSRDSRHEAVSHRPAAQGVFRSQRCSASGRHPAHGGRSKHTGKHRPLSDCTGTRRFGHELAQCLLERRRTPTSNCFVPGP